MNFTQSIVEKIRTDFVNEATNSPTLFNDLANMEKYISESYQGRSLIELLQNADDCCSTKFYLKRLDQNLFLVANNGKIFDEQDLISLCRSGASTKTRGVGKIGFRGIGFKSVVNYANEVYLYSGEYKLIFSRKLTKDVLKSSLDVPLIRVPHFNFGNKYLLEYEKMVKSGYNTVFIFETKTDSIKEEINLFSESCLLFLNHIKEVIFEYDSSKVISIERNKQFYLLKSDKEISEWIVLNNGDSWNKVSLAFKSVNHKAINLSSSYVHSFMPTNEKINLPFIINGDFSTDPSRTKIIIDIETKRTIHNVVSLMSTIVINALKEKKDEYGLINVMSCYKKDEFDFLVPNSIKNEIYNDYIEILSLELKKISKLENIIIQPDWFDTFDFDNYCRTKNYYPIYTKGNKNVIGLSNILGQIDSIKFDFYNLFRYMRENILEYNTRINLIVELMTKRYSFEGILKNELSNSYLFDYNNKPQKTKDIVDLDFTKDSFYRELVKNVNDNQELNIFLKQLGFNNIKNKDYNDMFTKSEKSNVKNIDSFNKDVDIHSLQTILSKSSSSNVEVSECKFEKRENPQKWRSVEKNMKIVFESFKDVNSVQDVTSNNLGYDLIVEFKSGIKKYVEVKSVNRLGDEFKMTPNEYATAYSSDFKLNYLLAIVEQNEDEMRICLIDNLENMNFDKRVAKYDYVGSGYGGPCLKYNLD